LIGTIVYSQAAVLDPAAPALHLTGLVADRIQ
jgi:hypothetical protein